MERARNKLYLPREPANRGHVPTKVSRLKVGAWAEVGTAKDVMARELGIGTTTLSNHYGVELAHAEERGVARVAASLYAKALAGDVTAMQFFLKSRGKKLGWGEDKNADPSVSLNLQLNLVKSITSAVSQMRQQSGESALTLLPASDMLIEAGDTGPVNDDDVLDLIGRRG